MKYYLIFGHHLLEKNKDFPKVRIYHNDVLIDDFLCDGEEMSNITLRQTEKYKHRFDQFPYTEIMTEERTIAIPKKHKLVELDGNLLKNNDKITFEVYENNSDYNNGFINKRSLASFFPVFILSEELLSNQDKMIKVLERSIRARYMFFTSRMENARWQWPGPHVYPGQEETPAHINKGGKNKFDFYLKKKYNTFTITQDTKAIMGMPVTTHALYAWYSKYAKEQFVVNIDHENQYLHNTIATDKISFTKKTKGVSCKVEITKYLHEDQRDNHT